MFIVSVSKTTQFYFTLLFFERLFFCPSVNKTTTHLFTLPLYSIFFIFII